MTYILPEGVQPLSERDYGLSRQYTSLGVMFTMHMPHRHRYITRNVAEVRWPHMAEWSTNRHMMYVLASLSDEYDPAGGRALAEALTEAASFCDYMDEMRSDEIARIAARREERQREYERRQEQRRREIEERMKRVAKKREELLPLIEDKFRLKRRGYKATVFGTIKSIVNNRMYTISEKNVPMTIDIGSIYWMEVKYEGDRHYTTIINEEP